MTEQQVFWQSYQQGKGGLMLSKDVIDENEEMAWLGWAFGTGERRYDETIWKPIAEERARRIAQILTERRRDEN